MSLSQNLLPKAGLLAATALLFSQRLVAQTSSNSTPTALTKAQIFRQLDPQMAEVILLYDAIKGTPS